MKLSDNELEHVLNLKNGDLMPPMFQASKVFDSIQALCREVLAARRMRDADVAPDYACGLSDMKYIEEWEATREAYDKARGGT